MTALPARRVLLVAAALVASVVAVATGVASPADLVLPESGGSVYAGASWH